MFKFLNKAASKLGFRRGGSSSIAEPNGCDAVAVDVTSQQCQQRRLGFSFFIRGGSSAANAGGDNDDISFLDYISDSKYLSEARKEVSTVEWKLNDFFHLNKVYMLDPGPNVIVQAGKTIDLPIEFKFSLENIYNTHETRSYIWLITEIVAAPPGVENVVCKFTTQVFTDTVKVKQLNGSTVTIPTSRKYPPTRIKSSSSSVDNDHAFNVGCLIPSDCVYSDGKLLTVKIQISLFSRRTQGTTEFTNIKETMDKSGDAFSVQIGSLLRDADGEGIMFSDVKLILKDGVTVQAHRAILASRSPVFKAMLLTDMEESKSGIIKIPEVEFRAMDVLLHHIYTGKVDPSCNQVIEQVIYAAAKYDLPQLLEYCDKIMITVCDSQNALAMLKLAKMHGLRNAIRDVTNYVKI